MPTDYPAQFNDGKTAASHAVTARPETNGLAILKADGTIVTRWPWRKVRLVEAVTPGRPIRLSNRDDPAENLAISDTSILPILQAFAPYLKRDPFDRQRILTIASIAGAIALMVVIFVYGPPLLAKPLAKLIPVAWEDDIGRQTANLVHRMFANGKTCDGAAGVATLEKLTARLAKVTGTPYELRLTVADTPVVNALALPGGRIILFRGLIEKAESAEEVTGVLAHELAHVTLRHPTQGLIVSVGWTAMLSALTGGASGSSDAVAQVASELATSAYSRDVEAAADAEGVAILERAGIDSLGLIGFFNMIKKLEENGVSMPAFFSSHPLTDNRIAAIKAASSGKGGPAMSKAEWAAVQKMCD
jgi:Zn-dependent protease with chaperone function